MNEPRNFIQEIIDTLSKKSIIITTLWNDFQNGKINKEEFEREYKNIMENLKEDVESEAYYPNNGCKYSVTCPSSNYFKTENI